MNANNTSATARLFPFSGGPGCGTTTTASPQRHHHEITHFDEMDIDESAEFPPSEQTSSSIGHVSSFETNTLEGQHQQANQVTQLLKCQKNTSAEAPRPSLIVVFRLTASGAWKASYLASREPKEVQASSPAPITSLPSREPTAQQEPARIQTPAAVPPVAGVVKRGPGRPRKIRTEEETAALKKRASPKKKAAPKKRAAPKKAAVTKPATAEGTNVNDDAVVAKGGSTKKDATTKRGALVKKDAAAKATTPANDDGSLAVADDEVEDPQLPSDKTSIPSTRVFGQGLKLKAARRIPRAEAPTSLFRAVPEVQHHRAPGRSFGSKQAAQPEEFHTHSERTPEKARRYVERSPEHAGQPSEKARVTPPWRKHPPPKFHPLPARPSPPPELESVSRPPSAMGERSKTQEHEDQSSFWGPAISQQGMITPSAADISQSFSTSVFRRNSIFSEGECTPSPSSGPKHPSATQPVATLSQYAAMHSLAEGSRQEPGGLERTPFSSRPSTSASTAYGTTPGSTFDLLAPDFMRRSESTISMDRAHATAAMSPSQQKLSSPIIGSASVLPSIEGGSPFVKDSAPVIAVAQKHSLSMTNSSPAFPSSQGHFSPVTGSGAVSSAHSSDSGPSAPSSSHSGSAVPQPTQAPISDMDIKGQEGRLDSKDRAGSRTAAVSPRPRTTPLPPWRDPNHMSAKHRRMANSNGPPQPTKSNGPPQPAKSLPLPPSLPRRPPGRLPDLPAAFRSGSHPTLITVPPAGFGLNQHRSSPYGFSPAHSQQYQQGGLSHGRPHSGHGQHQTGQSRYYGSESPSLGRGKGAGQTRPRPS